MKQLKMALVALVLTFGATQFSQAQDNLIAHINTQALVEAMPTYQAAIGELEKLQKSYQTTISDLGTELQSTMERYSREAETQTDEENLRRQKEVADTRNSIIDFQQNATNDIQTKNEELLKPIYEQARVTIQKVARAKGFKYVLDSTTGAAGVLMADGYDLMADVKADLGI